MFLVGSINQLNEMTASNNQPTLVIDRTHPTTSVSLVGYSLHNLGLYLITEFRIILEQILGGIAPLCQFAALIGEPRATLLHDTLFRAKVNQFAHLRYPLTSGDFKFGLAEWGCHLVFHHLYAHLVSYDILTILDRGDTTDVKAHA